MLSHENEEVRERVTTLERKVRSQEDEIVCLKSALSDALRRITSLEAGRSMSDLRKMFQMKDVKSQHLSPCFIKKIILNVFIIQFQEFVIWIW